MNDVKKAGARRDKPETRDEIWSDERVKDFLNIQPPKNMPADYAVLLKAYRSMTPELFARFIPFFVEAGRDLDARFENMTILGIVSGHRRSGDYVRVLEEAGAKK
ncbi:MAG: PA4642 family protein [Pseudohongiellaceae bacterium]